MVRTLAPAVVLASLLTTTACADDGSTAAPSGEGVTPRPTVEVKDELDGVVAEVVAALVAYAGTPEVHRDPGRGYAACSSQHKEWSSYYSESVRVMTESAGRDWASLGPRIMEVAGRHGFTRVSEMPASPPEHYYIIVNEYGDTVDLSVNAGTVGWFGRTSCFPARS